MRHTMFGLFLVAALTLAPTPAPAAGGACDALLAQLNQRYQDLGGDLAPRTKEFKAVKRGRKHLTGLSADPLEQAKGVWKAMKGLKPLDDDLIDGLRERVLEALLGDVDGRVTAMRAEFDVLDLTSFRSKGVAKLNKAAETVAALKTFDDLPHTIWGQFLFKANNRLAKAAAMLEKAKNAPPLTPIEGAIPPDLPKGKYRITITVDGQDITDGRPIGNLKLKDVAKFRKQILKLLNQWTNQFQKNSTCSTSLINHPWNGQVLGITLRITCADKDPGDPPHVTDIRFDITKVG